jgi:hypothetical protein
MQDRPAVKNKLMISKVLVKVFFDRKLVSVAINISL